MICTNCGNEIAEGCSFCTNCGAILNAEQLHNSENSNDDAIETNQEKELDNEESKEQNVSDSKETDECIEASCESVENPKNINPDTSECLSAKEKLYREKIIKSMKSEVRPLRTWSFFWRELITLLPIINLVVFFIQAFGEGVNYNSRSYARAKLICVITVTVVLLGAMASMLIWYDDVMNIIRNVIDSLYSYIH